MGRFGLTMKKLSKRHLNDKKSILIENVLDKYAMGDSIDEDGEDELLYIKNAVNTYDRCVEELLYTRDIAGISIQDFPILSDYNCSINHFFPMKSNFF